MLPQERTLYLLSGQAAGYTGAFVNTSIGRSYALMTYGSGVNSTTILNLYCPSPFFNESAPFLSIPVSGVGYNNIYYIQTPSLGLQASIVGSGNVWAALILRD